MDFLNYESEGEEINEFSEFAHHERDIDSESKLVDKNVVTENACNRKHHLLDMHLQPLVDINTNAETVQNISHYNDKGSDLTETLRANKQFGNPYILTKVVQILSSK